MKIWSMWFQGRAQAPELCRRVFDLWERLNPEHELYVMEGEEARALVEAQGVSIEGLEPAKIANLVRLDVLTREGGVWADATVTPFQSLDDWLLGSLDAAGFFAFRAPGRDRLLSSWLLYSEPGHPLTEGWRDALFAYYRERRKLLTPGLRTYRRCRRPSDLLACWAARNAPDRLWHVDRDRGWANPFTPYFVMHYLFEEMIRRDCRLARCWSAVPARSADLPHLVSHNYRMLGGDARWEEILDDLIGHAPVFKLPFREGEFRQVLSRAEEQVRAKR